MLQMSKMETLRRTVTIALCYFPPQNRFHRPHHHPEEETRPPGPLLWGAVRVVLVHCPLYLWEVLHIPLARASVKAWPKDKGQGSALPHSEAMASVWMLEWMLAEGKEPQLCLLVCTISYSILFSSQELSYLKSSNLCIYLLMLYFHFCSAPNTF